MKKTTLKIAAFLFVAMFAFQTNAQSQLWTKEAVYKIGARGTNLFMTADLQGISNELVWAEATDDPTKLQEWAIVNHRTPAHAGYMEITASHPEFGMFTMCTTEELIQRDAEGGLTNNMGLAWRKGEPKSVVKPIDTGNVDEDGKPIIVYSEDFSGYDQFQRRKTFVDENGDALPKSEGGKQPAGSQNNALFIKLAFSGAGSGARFGKTPKEAGETVKFDGGGIDVIDFVFVKDIEVASTTNFDASSLSISNPVNDRLIVRGINSDITKLSVYNLLGSKVLSKNLTGNSSVELSVSNLVSGMYIVKLEGANKAFSKKIIKQ